MKVRLSSLAIIFSVVVFTLFYGAYLLRAQPTFAPKSEPLTTSQVEELNKAIDLLRQWSLYDIDSTTVLQNAIEGIYQGVDPHTIILSPEEYKEESREMKGDEFFGVGLMLTQDPEYKTIKVVSPVDGTPAAKAG